MFPQVVVSCGPNPIEVREAAELSSEHGGRVLSTGGFFRWGQLATLLAKASLFVGVDTAAMHLAAAVQCPAVVLFGHAPAYQFRPWKSPHRVVRARDHLVETERYRLPGEQLMEEIPVTSAMDAIGDLLAEVQTRETSL
jgi:heptosyltransferase-3